PGPFLSRTRSTQCCVEFSSLRQPQPCCWSPSLPTTPMLAVAEVAAIGAVAEATAAALSQFEGLGAALSQCVAGATAIGVGPIAAMAAIAATVSVRPRWA